MEYFAAKTQANFFPSILVGQVYTNHSHRYLCHQIAAQ